MRKGWVVRRIQVRERSVGFGRGRGRRVLGESARVETRLIWEKRKERVNPRRGELGKQKREVSEEEEAKNRRSEEAKKWRGGGEHDEHGEETKRKGKRRKSGF